MVATFETIVNTLFIALLLPRFGHFGKEKVNINSMKKPCEKYSENTMQEITIRALNWQSRQKIMTVFVSKFLLW